MDAVVVGGGGIRGVALLGAVQALVEAGALGQCRTFVGTSSGALVCTALATQRDLVRTMSAIGKHPYKPDFDLAGVTAKRKFGLDTGRNFEAWTARVLGLDPSLTFEEVRRRFGSELVVCATDVTNRRAVYFGYRSHPDMAVTLALRMSCAVPMLFSAVEFQGAVYADGALVDNFPVGHAVDVLGCKRPMGVCASPVVSPERRELTSLDAYMGSLVDCLTSARRSPIPRCAAVLEVDAGDNSTNLSPGPAEVRALFRKGRDQGALFVKKTV